jgi:hypothetical protein
VSAVSVTSRCATPGCTWKPAPYSEQYQRDDADRHATLTGHEVVTTEPGQGNRDVRFSPLGDRPDMALVRPKAERVLDALSPALDPDVCDWLDTGRDR